MNPDATKGYIKKDVAHRAFQLAYKDADGTLSVDEEKELAELKARLNWE